MPRAARCRVTVLALQSRFFVRPEARFSAPTRAMLPASRGGAVKAAHLARPRGLGLDSSEHDATLEVIGAEATICTPSAVQLASRCGPRNMLTAPSGYS